MSQVVDRRNLDFLLFEVLGLDEMLAENRFCRHDRLAISTMLDVVQVIAEKEFLPCAAELDAQEPRIVDGRVVLPPRAKQALDAAAAAGLFAAGFDEELGGLQLPAAVSIFLNGLLACANIALANYPFLTVANANMLNSFGTEEQKARFLPPMLQGRWFGTMCLSEPQAGSSLSDILTRAEPAGDGGYRIMGSKMWISGGEHELSENIVHMVLARLPGAAPGVKGISLFIVPKYRVDADGTAGAFNNVALVGLNHKMGQRGTTNCVLNFGEAGDSIGHLVGEPHKGLSYMFHMMNEARIVVGTNAVMLGLAGYLCSLDYARTRLQGRRAGNKDPGAAPIPIIEHADVKRMLLNQKAAVEGAMALAGYCATLMDRRAVAASPDARDDTDLLLELLTPVCKSWPSEHCLRANELAIQVLGGYGYTRDYPVERHYRDNRLNHIHEGTFAIHGIDLLGRKVRLRDGRALRLLVDRIEATIGRATAASAFPFERERLTELLAALDRATRAVIASDDPELGLANATLYLDAFGTIAVAWLWLEQALAAAHALEAGPPADDAAFYEGKLAASRFFFRYAVPGALCQLRLVESLDDTCLRMSTEAFLGR